MNINWMKLDVNILNDSKIKMIRKYPAGNDLFVLWVGLLCLAMKSENTGYIYIADGIPYSDNELAMELDLEEKTVQLGLGIFKKYRMIDITTGGAIEIINFNKHQQIEKIEKIRKQNKKRQYEYRNRKRNALLTHDSCVGNDTDKIRLDKTRLDKKRLEDKESGKPEHLSMIIDVIKYLNKKLNTQYRSSSKKTRDLLIARFREGYSVEDAKSVINKKYDEWSKDKKMCVYLRPETLFSNKFESYLNQTLKKEIKYVYDQTETF